MAATAINGIRLSKSGAKAGLVADGSFDTGLGVVWDIGWRGRRLVQSSAKPNMRRKTHQPVQERGDGNNRICLNYPITALIRIIKVTLCFFKFNVNLRLTPSHYISLLWRTSFKRPDSSDALLNEASAFSNEFLTSTSLSSRQ